MVADRLHDEVFKRSIQIDPPALMVFDCTLQSGRNHL